MIDWILLSLIALLTSLVSVISLVIHFIFSISESSISNFNLRVSWDKSKATTGIFSLTSNAATQLPMHPPAPVTRTGTFNSLEWVKVVFLVYLD